MKATLDHIVDEAENIRAFWFKTEQNLEHTAGQFTQLTLPHPDSDERGVKRWFTISSSPTELPLFSITTKFAGDKSSSFKKALWQLKPGDTVEAASAMGDFVLPKDESIPLVFIAGGIGITPFRSITRYLLDTHQTRDIRLIYAANKADDLAFLDLFKAQGIEPILVIGEPLTGQKIIDLAGGIKNQLFYWSGPKPMVTALVEETKHLGLPDSQIVLDYFPGYTAI